MSESLVGVIVTRTRQKARGALNGFAPAGTISVRVILAAGIATPARVSHDPAAAAGTGPVRSAKEIAGAVASVNPLRHRARIVRSFIAEFLEDRLLGGLGQGRAIEKL
jgi:hypothetical protein